MALRLNVLVIYLLFTVGFVLSAKDSGKSKKKNRTGPAKLSENISKNPFLQSVDSSPTLSENINNNLFLQSHGTTINANRGNPFLSNINLPPLSPNNDNNQIQNTSENDSVSEATVNENVVFNKHNPFLQGSFNADNNHVQTNPLLHSDRQSSRKDRTTDEDTKSKSEIKCEEYGRQISGTTEVLFLAGTPIVRSITSKTCTSENQLVVGGETATPGEFPHMVAIGARNPDGTFRFLCGGTLIAPEWILTAAHCTHKIKLTDARIGFHDLRVQNGVMAGIAKVIRHPNYRIPALYADIALLKLSITVEFNKTIRPACLYQMYDTVPEKAWVSGWGVTEFDGDKNSDELQKAELDILDNLVCSRIYGTPKEVPYGISPSMICAQDRKEGKRDTCGGDSGGPLQIVTSKNSCLYHVVGVTSFGIGCGNFSTGVYTRVSHYLPWIEDIVWPET